MALRTAAIQMIWPDDEGSFYRKLVDTLGQPGFAGVDLRLASTGTKLLPSGEVE